MQSKRTNCRYLTKEIFSVRSVDIIQFCFGPDEVVLDSTLLLSFQPALDQVSPILPSAAGPLVVQGVIGSVRSVGDEVLVTATHDHLKRS